MKDLLKRTLLGYCLLIVTGLLGQQSPVKPFGQITLDDMKISMCPYDSSAPAMILFDKGEAEMDIGRGSSYKRHVRIKIFKKDLADKWASKVVYYSKGSEAFGKFKASTYNLVEGKIVETKIADDALFKEKFDKVTNQARFTLPQVSDGCIIEYTYTISSSDIQLLPDWQFQYDIPVLWSEYITTIPIYFTFKKDWQGFLHPSISDSKFQGQERIVITNAPAFKPEPFMSSEENYISKVKLYVSEIWVPGEMVRKVIKSWGHVAGSVYESELGAQIRTSGYLKKIAEEQTTGITDPEKKLHALYDYVKKNIAWNDFTDVFPDREFKDVLESKKGSSSEINGILISILKKADIEAEPVLLRTRDEGKINPFLPMVSQFNDVICQVKLGEKTLLIDATNPGLPINALPERCLNGQGFMVSKEVFDWVALNTIKSRRVVSGDFTLNEDGALSGKLTISRDGIFAGDVRKAFKSEGQEKYVKAVVQGKTWEVSKSTFENIDDYKASAKEVHELAIPDQGQVAGEIIYINPIVHGRMEENQFKLEKRDYPVDYGAPFDNIYLAKIILPQGYAVEEIPQPKIFVLPEGGGKYIYNVTVVGNMISVVSQFIINKSSFSTEEYPILREFYTQVVAKQNEQVVLKKK